MGAPRVARIWPYLLGLAVLVAIVAIVIAVTLHRRAAQSAGRKTQAFMPSKRGR